ncbi:hypothetical protein FBU30_003895 [Linnemannia zychae]|nr:hypothetical protein FBU30_003895 [Linnemannia zychae]
MRCQDCDQVYFCSETCKAIAMDPQQGCHAKVCRALRKLATWNTDRHTKSIVKLFVQVLMNHWRERQGFLSAYQSRRRILEQERANGNIRLEQIRTQEQEQEQELMKCQSKKDNTIDTLVKDINERLVTINITPALLSPEPTPQPASPTSPSSHLSDAHNNNCNDNDKSQRTQEPIENDFYDVLRLQSHFEDWDDEDQKDWNKQSQTVLSLLELAGLTEMALTPQGPLVKLTSLDIKRLISALESNAFGMFDRTKKKPVCFGRAVQADGSAEEITGNAVLGLVEQEEANKHQIPELSSTPGSESGASTPIQPSTGTATPIEGDEQEGKDLASMIEDPYDSRVGEFRMMTFFAIRDILKGNFYQFQSH